MTLDSKGKNIETFQRYHARQRSEGELDNHPSIYINRFKTTQLNFYLFLTRVDVMFDIKL